jgi:MFS family permease
MQLWRFKAGVFVLEWLNAFATSLYFNYLFFYLHKEYGFSTFQNLLFCALNGFVYTFSAWYAGKFGQKRGYMVALTVGFVTMAAALMTQGFVGKVQLHLALMITWTLGMTFTWPNLEALVAEREQAGRLPKLIGIYNVTWASGTAVAYFVGGAIIEKAGWRAMFWIPAGLHVLQLVLASFLAPRWHRIEREIQVSHEAASQARHPEAALFLKMAWLANPFAYIAMNAAIPMIPDLAERLRLSPRLAGYFCSIWFFSRMVTFAILALWPGWHYRFRWLISSYVGVIFCFCGMLLLNSLWAVILVQVAFGWCVGLIYYSSLYYSMDVGEEKGSHGGMHEAAIGTGIFGGPAIGALSAYMFPERPASSVWGVALVLCAGFIGLIFLGKQRSRG